MTERRRFSMGSVLLIVLAVLFIYYLFSNMGGGKDVSKVDESMAQVEGFVSSKL